jgi:23S rRNA (cytosine1962-C5)-methyltransferase
MKRPSPGGEISFWANNTPFRHLGFFPDMGAQFDWLASRIKPGDRVMNMFGYTGVGSLIAARAGAQVTHVDASKKSVAVARENAALSGLGDAPVRWIIDDALKFLRREVRRGAKYHGLIFDPPKYGRGPDGEVWRLEEDLPEMIANCRQLLDANSRFLFLTVYAVRMSALALGNLVQMHFADLPGKVEFGELAVREEARGLLLPTAIFARWSQPELQQD